MAGIDLSKMTPMPWKRTIDPHGLLFVETDQSAGNETCCIIATASPYPIEQLTEPERHIADMDFIVLASRAFRVMMRRGWHAAPVQYSNKIRWRVYTVTGADLNLEFYVEHSSQGEFDDPFTALCEAEDWLLAQEGKAHE